MSIHSETINRQAVVIIHGMGEQRPNSTIRGFTRCLIEQLYKNTHQTPVAYEKPDKVSGTFETRSKTILRDESAGRPTTHIFEFYWAHHMRDTKGSQVWSWVSRLLRASPASVPKRLRKVYWFLWGIVLLTLAALVLYLTNRDFHTLWVQIAGIGWLAALAGGAWGFLKSTIISTLGDAARYMSDSPDNVGERQKIRQEGIDLLRHLHERVDEFGKPLYDRIIVAAHSLGTAVAYDLLRLAWVEYSETYDKSIPAFPNTALEAMEAGNYRDLEEYRRNQYECWKIQRRAGNRWLVTDFVTMGAPLAYFDYLIVGSRKEFDRRVVEREYPACPPMPDPQYQWHWPVLRPGGTERINLLSYSSPFACIRWTNLYFTTDFIGGPLQPVLGMGIKDVPVEITGRGWKSLLPVPFGHTEYWSDGSSKNNAMDKVVEAMGLECNS